MTDKQIITKSQMIMRIAELSANLQAKEQECEELRKANDEKNELLAKLGCPTIATARRKVFCLQEQLDQLKQILAEIKEIAKKQCNICEALTPIDEYKDCKKCWQGKILQKISECEVENERN